MKRLLFLFASLLIYGAGHAQNGLWQPVNEDKVALLDKTDRVAMPSAYHLFNLDDTKLKAALALAPARNSGTSSVIIEFPDGEGALQHYRIYEASVMHPELAAKNPDIKSYVGQGIENPAATIRFSTTIFGLHAMVLSPQGTVYTEPFTQDLKNYIVYKKADLKENKAFTCGTVNKLSLNGAEEKTGETLTTFSNDATLRTFRLAMACTSEYSEYHFKRAGRANGTVAQKKEAVLAAMAVTMTRVDGVYEKELAITMQLVPNNQDIIFITTDRFDNVNADNLIEQSQSIITSTIGAANFDIGHTVSTGGGGLALLGVVCVNGEKASGITGSRAPVGDPYDIDFVAHEMGHQFGADHTFNGRGGSCQGNASSSTSVEPGSGTTIMAYAGICDDADIQSNSDAYFNTVSLDEIYQYILTTGCAETTAINNTAPVVSVLSSRTIPKSTPFVLRGSNVIDAQGDALTYCWEQTDATGTHVDLPTATATSGPNFRSFPPITSKDRYIPQFGDVLEGVQSKWEKLPSVARNLNFAYTVRDNNVNGGQTARANMRVIVNSTAGPFVVTSQNAFTTWEANKPQTITWNVAGTTANNINTATVNILLSTDGGQTFSTVLASATGNDGSETITAPNLSVAATDCRIMIEAVGNIFYAVNEARFSISARLSTEDFGLKNFSLYPNPNNGSFTIAFSSLSQNNIGVVVYDMRGREVFANSYANTGLFTGTVNLSGAQAGVYMVNVQDGTRKEIRKVVVR